jgi:imidazolonepropionase-like amidohydrolase
MDIYMHRISSPCLRVSVGHLLLLFAPLAMASPEVPGRAPEHPVALVGGLIHPVDGPDIPGGVLVMDGGRITAVGGPETPIPENAQRIDVTGRHVYPGLIAPHSDLGLFEIESVRATRDQAEAGQINPNVKAQVAFNPDSELIPVARSNGVLLAVTAPTGGLISGTCAVMQLDGWTWEDMTLRADAGMIVNWPKSVGDHDWLSGTTEAVDNDSRISSLRTIRQAIADARAYQLARQSRGAGQPEPEHDSRWEGLLRVLEGRVPLVVQADAAADIQSAVAFAVAEKLKIVILGGYDAPHCAALLKQHDVPVIVGGTHRLPNQASEAYDESFTTPRRLYESGVRFCIGCNESAWNARNLPYQAATAAAFGLPPDVALRSITLSAAEVLGIADRAGSLTVDKDATLFVSDGDPLEIATHVEQAWIQGRPIELSDRQKRLWHKYQEKYRRVGANEDGAVGQ